MPAGIERLRNQPREAQAGIVAEIVAGATPWMSQTLADLRGFVVGPTLERAWQVWSNGRCPACSADVRMYEWRAAGMEMPWKLACPRCDKQFPTNDFESYYCSGLDADGLFQAELADRGLLVNEAHPNADDPLRDFGVDDGTGYRSDAGHWRFVAAYLIYGQWKQRVVQGIVRLSDAFAVTGHQRYATRAAVMLHRVAELYPSYDFQTQGVMYDKPSADSGYISVWHDACEETRELALAYDRIAPGIVDADSDLCTEIGDTAAGIRAVIQHGILEDPLANPMKIYSNFPQRQVAEAVFRMVLDPVKNRDGVLADLDTVIERSVRCNGSTGEKGMQNYTAFATRGLTDLLTLFSEMDRALVGRWLAAHPDLGEIWRFHVHTWCQQRFFPTCGDAGGFAESTVYHPALDWGTGIRTLATRSRLALDRPSFLYRLYRETGDPLYARLIYTINGDSLDSLPPLLAEFDAETIKSGVATAIAKHGAAWPRGGIDLDKWHLAIQRSGAGEQARDLWMDYDNGGMHSHHDALNLGLFAYGYDLMSDFGYPPVGHAGGWTGAKTKWYKSTAAHNTVVVDRQEQNVTGWRISPRPDIDLTFNPTVRCRTRLWIDQAPCHGMLCESQAYSQCTRYERLSIIVDVDDVAFYVVDILRVAGGGEHVKFQHTLFATLTVEPTLQDATEDFGPHAQMRGYRWAAAPTDRWSASFVIDDRRGSASHGETVMVDYHDLTRDAIAGSCEAWVVWNSGNACHFNSPMEETWIPRVMTRRAQRSDEPLASCFVALIVPHRGDSPVRGIRRVDAGDPMNVKLEVELNDGRIDKIVATDDDHGFVFHRR